jgi:hypothetical protein
LNQIRMEILQQAIVISSTPKKVWDTMLQDATYRLWTKEFNPTSYYQGNWEQGSEIKFLGIDDHGKTQGMYSRIKESRIYEFISIEHLGIIEDGAIDTTSDKVKKWAPSYENYTFIKEGSNTLLKIEMQIDPEYKAMFEEMWGRALTALKALCEK